MADELYSSNQLTNPSAADGTTSGWTASGATAVEGGTDPDKNNFCFKLEENGTMEQTKTFSIQPPDCKVAGDYLPELERESGATDVEAYMEVVYTYADGSRDTFVIPCR